MGKHLSSWRILKCTYREAWAAPEPMDQTGSVSVEWHYNERDSLRTHLELPGQQAKGLSCPPMVLTLGGSELGYLLDSVMTSLFAHLLNNTYGAPIVWDAVEGKDLCSRSLGLFLTQRGKSVSWLTGQSKMNFPALVAYLSSQNLLHLWNFLKFMNC